VNATACDSAVPALRKRKRAKHLLLGVITSSLALFLALLGAELGLRVFAPQEVAVVRRGLFTPDDTFGYRRAPNLNVQINTGERDVWLVTDEKGHRVAKNAPASDNDAVRVLAVGDSFVEALSVEYERTFSALIEAALRRELNRSVKVVNAGVGAWEPSHYLLEARRELADSNYDLVLVCLYLGNDLKPTRSGYFRPAPNNARDSFFRIPRRLAAEEFRQSLADPLKSVLEQYSHLYVLARNVRYTHFELVDSRKVVQDYARSGRGASPFDIAADVCADLAKMAGAIPVVFAVIPDHLETFGETYSDAPESDKLSRPMLEALEKRGLRTVDLTPALVRAEKQGPSVFGRIDRHFSPRGHEIAAAVITPVVLERLHAREQERPTAVPSHAP